MSRQQRRTDWLAWQAQLDGQAETPIETTKNAVADALECDFRAIGQGLRRETNEALAALSFAGLEAQILGQIAQEKPKPLLWRRFFVLAGAGTALCLALFGAFLVGQNEARESLVGAPGVVVERLALEKESQVEVFEAKGGSGTVTVIWLGEAEEKGK